MIHSIRSRLSMRMVVPCLFVDKVSRKAVGLWVDRYGEWWMAASRWGMRVKRVQN